MPHRHPPWSGIQGFHKNILAFHFYRGTSMQPSFQAKRHAVVVPAVPRPSSNSNTQHEELPPALPPSLLKAPEPSQSSTYIFA